MTVIVAYEENGQLYLAPDTVPWAYEENGKVYVREFPPVLTVDESERVFIRLPADGPLTYEVWGERPQVSLEGAGVSATLLAGSRGSSLSAPGQRSGLVLERTEAEIE